MVNFWFPRQVVDDIWRTSDPKVERGLLDLSIIPNSPLVRAWWMCWVLAALVGVVGLLGVGDASIEELRPSMVIQSLSTTLRTVAAVLLILIVSRIDRWQDYRGHRTWANLDPASPQD